MIHIACNIDHQFIQHCAVTLVSLFINNPGQVFCVHIVAGSLPQEDQDLLTKLAAPYGHTVRFYFPPADLLKNYSIKKFLVIPLLTSPLLPPVVSIKVKWVTLIVN